MSQGTSVRIVFDYGLGDRGSIPGTGEEFFLLASGSRPAIGTHPPSYKMGTGDRFPGVKCSRSVTLITPTYSQGQE